MSHEKIENFPVGSGEEFVKERKKETLPALEVKNRVLWVNPAFPELPFKLQKGKQTKLGMFFTPEPKKYPEEKARQLPITPEFISGRSGIASEVIFKDADGNLYRDVDIKGIGNFYKRGSYIHETRVQNTGKTKGDSSEAHGIVNYGHALRDKEYSEKFLKKGIRTYRIIALVEPEEIINDAGQKISVEEAKKQKILSKEIQPTIEIRAFGTKERLSYIDPQVSYFERADAALNDARKIVAQELGKNPDKFTLNNYFKWGAKTMGQELAKLRKAEWHHGYLTPHNITLDFRIVDLDSVTTVKEMVAQRKAEGINKTENALFEQEYAETKLALSGFISCYARLYEMETDFDFRNGILDIFKDAYQKELGEKPGEKK